MEDHAAIAADPVRGWNPVWIISGPVYVILPTDKNFKRSFQSGWQ